MPDVARHELSKYDVPVSVNAVSQNLFVYSFKKDYYIHPHVECIDYCLNHIQYGGIENLRLGQSIYLT